MELKNTPDPKSRQVSSNVSSTRVSEELPVKVHRVRSNSTSLAEPASSSPPTRKRTSSGMFEVDESAPVPKKTELTRSLSDSPRKKSEVLANGCQKTTAKENSEKKEKGMEKSNKEEKEPNVVEKFDDETKSNCVSAFKESESWD